MRATLAINGLKETNCCNLSLGFGIVIIITPRQLLAYEAPVESRKLAY